MAALGREAPTNAETTKMKRSLLVDALVAACLLAPSARGDEWAQFRGPHRTGHSAETGLLKSWPAGGPKRLWLSPVDLGKGHSSVAVTRDAIYTTGVSGTRSTTGYVHRLDLDGKLKWKVRYGPEWTKNFLFSRTTPTVEGERLYVMSGVGRIACLGTADGAEKWAVDTRRVYGAQDTRWGLVESPLICDEKVIATPGGSKASIVAFHKITGKEIWSVNIGRDKSAYCSPIRVKDGKKDLIVTMLEHNVVGVDTATGTLLWKTPYAGRWGVHCNSPIYHEGQIYVSSGYDAGGLMVKLAADGKSVERLWTDETLDAHHGAAMRIDGHIYGSNWIDNSKGNWICLDWKTGKVKFDTRYENKGALIAAEGMIYCYIEQTGTVALVKPDPAGWKPVSSFKIKEGSGQHWAHPAISNGRLYVRHGGALMAYDIKAPR